MDRMVSLIMLLRHSAPYCFCVFQLLPLIRRKLKNFKTVCSRIYKYIISCRNLLRWKRPQRTAFLSVDSGIVVQLSVCPSRSFLTLMWL